MATRRSRKPKVEPRAPKKPRIHKPRGAAPSRFARRPRDTGDDMGYWYDTARASGRQKI